MNAHLNGYNTASSAGNQSGTPTIGPAQSSSPYASLSNSYIPPTTSYPGALGQSELIPSYQTYSPIAPVPQEHPSTTALLVFSLISLLFFPLGALAFIWGMFIRKEIRANPTRYRSDGILTASLAISLATTVLTVLAILAFIAFFVVIWLAL